MAANPEYAAGGVIANKYVVEGLLGESPAARSFLATGSAGKLCVKFYRPEVSARLLAAPDFFLKAGVMTEIGHDNLCGCIDVQEEMGMVFVARSFAEGQSLEDWIRGHLGAGNYYSRGLELLWQTCQGLAALHDRTRHLDIHPGNVLVGPIMAKLCDWDPRALSNMEMTPDALPIRPEYLGYRAPEQAARGSFLSYPSTDLFAVAGLLYRLVRGEHPSAVPAQNMGEIRAMDKEVAAFLVKAMHPRPEERFQEASAFSDALWDLQGAMHRLQEKGPRPGPVPPPSPAPVREKTEAGFRPPPPGNDTFFNFFPSAEAAPAPAANAGIPEAKPSGDTLFGGPAFASRPASDFGFPPPAPEPARPSNPPASGMGGLEVPGTLFGSQPDLFTPPPKPASRRDPPAPPKPMAVSLSSLESDPVEMAGNATSGGFTTYGFKGAGENRTGNYAAEAPAASAKTKLLIALGAAGALLLLLGMAGLYLYLRGSAAPPQEAAAETDSSPEAAETPRYPEAQPPPQPEASPSKPSPAQETAPYPEVPASPDPVPEERLSDRKPAGSGPGYSEPPMPVEPARPGSEPAGAALAPAGKPASATGYPGNTHVTPEREAALMAMARKGEWPASAAERLKAADELNDLGRIAEANLAYTKALSAADIGEKQKVLAYGGQAVTFRSMGMPEQARDAVQKILDINPRNGFALKLKEKLK